MKWAPVLLLSLLAGCADLPRDQDGTLDRLRAGAPLRVGLVSIDRESPHRERLLALAQRSAAAMGARIEITHGPAEPLLMELEEGELDMVLGAFDRASPWYSRVHLIPPLISVDHARGTLEATAALRNGENGWIMIVEREARALAGGA
jgi:hypothetical protein